MRVDLVILVTYQMMNGIISKNQLFIFHTFCLQYPFLARSFFIFKSQNFSLSLQNIFNSFLYSMVQKSRFELKTQQSKCCVIPFHHFWICIASPHRSSFNIRIFLQIKNRKEVSNISIFFLGGVYKKIYAAIFKGFIARWSKYLDLNQILMLPKHSCYH